MLSQQLRRSFLNYFKSKGHALVASSPVVPHDDPTLLFINAGMNQFKDVFLGKAKRDYTRAATTQKCIRVGGKHNDLDNVGHTSRHLTFFEMLGNFSFGDYFKKEAIDFAWEVSTKVFGFDPEKIWVSVFQDDDEAFALWERHMPAKRLVRFGEKENFWAMGETGPCGPCSELLYDRGEGYGGAKSPKEDVTGERYLEFWNLVFMQFERDVSGKLNPLPKQSIDTGSGLERVVSLKMGVDSVFQTDILRHLIGAVERVSGKRYDPKEEKVAPAFHVIADHLRSLSFAIGDGVQPSNTDRGYVLRKILRRAVRYGRMLGLKEPFLATLYPSLVEVMGEDFPELKSAKGRIEEILTLEEEAFLRTLQRGGQLLGQVIERSRSEGATIRGEDAFKLKDTYGFPVEEILLIAKDENLSVDVKRFEALEEEAKEKSRKAQKTAAQQFDANFFEEFVKTNPPTRFEGYGKTEGEGAIVALVVGGAFVSEMKEGEEGLVLLDQTPFYAEMGGQVGDVGLLVRGGSHFQVTGCTSPYAGLIAHRGKMGSGKIAVGQTVSASVDRERRHFIQNHHTATHLLHWALEKVLGSHIKQAGSLVEKERLRFDFSHHKPLSREEIRQIEELVNEKIRSDRGVETYELSYEEAQKRGDIKQFFGEKYGAKVRVVDLDFSKELCGGTHASRLGAIGLFKILKEGSIAAGVRRIEAASGPFAEQVVYQGEELLWNLSQQLKAPQGALAEKVAALLEENRTLLQQLKGARKEELKRLALEWAGKKEALNGSSHLVAAEIALSSEEMALLAEELLGKIGSGVIVLGSRGAEKCHLLIAMSSDLISEELDATKLIKEAAPLIQGGGGGKPHLAQAGGKNPNGFPAAFETVRARLRR